MTSRLAFALLTVLFAVASPAAANAQAPVDERANARAFAGIGLQLAGELETASQAMAAAMKPPACLDRLDRRLQKAPARRAAAVGELFAMQGLGVMTRAAGPGLVRALADMHAIRTADPALRGGRTAWRRIHRVYASFAALPVSNVCAEARAFLGNGFRRTPAMRQAQRTLRTADRTGGIDRRLARAVKRLAELGVPAADADLFDGPFSD